MGRLNGWGADLLRMIYPEVCEVCGTSLARGEDVMCLHCLLGLPRTLVHDDTFNIIHKRLAGSVPIERAAGYFYYYRESGYARLILNAKYRNRPLIDRRLAARYAREIESSGFFDGIDMILPVPMHRFKKIRRGYNQSDYIARGLNDVTGITIGKNLVARRGHATQTRKNSYARWLNAQDIYEVRDAAGLEGKHVLVVDDVITTGATMLACCKALRDAAPTVTISVLSLAVTHLA